MLLLKSMPSSKSANPSIPRWLTENPIAHRGLHDIEKGVPENSLAAFSLACEQGYAIELDLHLSADGHLVVIHDASLQRTVGITKDVSACPLNELMPLKLEGTEEKLPSFRQALGLVRGKVPLVIELKTGDTDPEHYISVLLSELEGYEGNYSVQSFNPFLLLALKRRAPQIIRGQLGMQDPPEHLSLRNKMVIKKMPFNFRTKPHYLAYQTKGITARLRKRADRAGIPLLAWTVDSNAELEIAKAMADNIIFEKITPPKFAR
ncbi:glycerophosphodiester phosphodiesterase [Sneathiella sp. P13V-1]|uniref:glycerophosphodiester phosphodiesterase family protein n=1 Tax=Sneathiella sp. P13V-1 TaxID=2697366 RepID=UPI00187B71F2|nr:glycerophosphodiester phosphodiesterase family protein [Sneathiella sp. P13V-1]MBE7636857.1 glycerophosphodiester phosphodiesterase [Sneathiella sp. P13V-1]